MTPEQACVLRLLEDYIHRRPSAPPETEVDWARVAQYGEEQSLSGILYVQCRDFLGADSPALQQMHRGFYAAAYASENSAAALGEVGARFEGAGVAYLPFKGAVLRDYYPQPELRTMGDMDVLIHARDREATDAILLGLGYQKYVDNHAVWTYYKGKAMFEIHDVMFYEYLSNSVDYRGYFQHIWETARSGPGTCCRPEPNRHFLYLVAHTAKHIINNGMGLRAFLDLVFMAQGEPELQWDWIAGELEGLELLGFTKTCFALCERWFHVTMPLASGTLDEGFFEEITAKTFHDGTFGLHNQENAAAHSAKEIHRSDGSYWKAALGLTWRKLFPPYEDMQLVPWYRFVDGRPWLMPVAWVYRWFYVASHKWKHSRDLLLEPFEKRDVIEKREKLIDDWKL